MALSDRIVVMSHGRVAQVGAPHEIYNTPWTRFVASFVGTLNILSATVIDAHHVRIGETVWQVADAIVQPVGSSVECAVRPELLREATPDLPNQLTWCSARCDLPRCYSAGNIARSWAMRTG
jgi:ABC-type Fe3+/spermidine/putrescine transport system ATPase subunit